MNEYRVWKRFVVRDYSILANPDIMFSAKQAYFKEVVNQLAEEMVSTGGFEGLCADKGDFSEICVYVTRKDNKQNELR